MPKYLSASPFFFLKRWLPYLMAFQQEDDKWAPTIDGMPEDITMDVDSSFFNLDHYDETLSPNLTNSRSSTLPEDSGACDIASDVMMTNIRRKRPRPSKKQSIASNDAVNACIIDLVASFKAST